MQLFFSLAVFIFPKFGGIGAFLSWVAAIFSKKKIAAAVGTAVLGKIGENNISPKLL